MQTRAKPLPYARTIKEAIEATRREYVRRGGDSPKTVDRRIATLEAILDRVEAR